MIVRKGKFSDAV